MKVKLSPEFKRKLKKVLPPIQEKTFQNLRLFKADPLLSELNDHALRVPYLGSRSINVTGDYRALYKPYPGLAYFYLLGTHKELYGK